MRSDPAVRFANEFKKWYGSDVYPYERRLNQEITLLYRDYMRGQMAFEPEKSFFPDANLTLRVAYGSIAGYSPADGVYYEPVSTLEGIMEKDNPEIFDYNIPQRLRDIYAAKDYGQWAITTANGKKTVPVCFIATNHTSGGNSGSPVINILKEPYRAAPRHGYHLPHHLGRSRLALDEDFRVIHLQNNSQRRCKAAAFESQRLFLLAKVILRVFEFPLIFLNQKATFVLLTELHFGQLGKRLHWAQR